MNLELLFKFLCMIWFGSDKVKSKVENRNMVLLSKKVLVEFFLSTYYEKLMVVGYGRTWKASF